MRQNKTEIYRRRTREIRINFSYSQSFLFGYKNKIKIQKNRHISERNAFYFCSFTVWRFDFREAENYTIAMTHIDKMCD